MPRRWLYLILFFYITISFKSSGYHQEDEHYQIIEFANYKLGLVPADRLAWEFEAQIRPGLHPLVCYVLFKGFHILGITDGYTIAFLLRALTAVASVLAIHKFINAYRHRIARKVIPWFIVLSYLLWFLPYINIRFSSETWSGLFFLLSLAFIENNRYNRNIKKFLWIGILWGIAILFRYQSGLLVAGMIAWFLLIDKPGIKSLSVMAMSVFFVLIAGVFIDRWLYGDYVLTIYNYFHVNLVQGVSASFGVSPWYEYLYYILTSPGPFGVFIFAAFFVMLYHEPKNIVLWAIIPFLVIHSLIPHKELRFLFPIANVIPLFLILAFQKIYKGIIKHPYSRNKYLGMALLVICVVINITGLIAISSTGAGTARTVVTEYIHRNYDSARTNIIIVGDINPYMDWGPPKNSFYSSSGLKIKRVSSIWQDDFMVHKQAGLTNLLIIAENDITGPRGVELLKNRGLLRVYQNIPPFVKFIYDIYDPSLNDYRLNVYEFK